MTQMPQDANKYKQKSNIRVESTVEISKILLREYQHLNPVLVIIHDDEQLQLTAIMNNSFKTRTKIGYDGYVIKMLSLFLCRLSFSFNSE